MNGKYKVYNYQNALELMQLVEFQIFQRKLPFAFVSWGNTPRRGKNGIIIQGSTLELFRSELIMLRNKVYSTKDNLGLIFINAWIEWAEGNFLEPYSLNGTSFFGGFKKYRFLNVY